jgi:hypothetical protein
MTASFRRPTRPASGRLTDPVRAKRSRGTAWSFESSYQDGAMRQRSQSNCLRLPAHFSSAARVKKSMSEPVDAVRNDPTWKSHPFSRLSVTSVLLLVLCAQSSALARGSGFSHDEPWSSERIDRLPPEVRNSVYPMCRVKPTAAQYFATYLDHARIIKLHFEYFSCDGQQVYHELDRCLREEFVASGSHYRLLKTYYARCGD